MLQESCRGPCWISVGSVAFIVLSSLLWSVFRLQLIEESPFWRWVKTWPIHVKMSCSGASRGNVLAILVIICCIASIEPSSLQSYVVGSVGDMVGLGVGPGRGLFPGHYRLLSEEEGYGRFPWL